MAVTRADWTVCLKVVQLAVTMVDCWVGHSVGKMVEWLVEWLAAMRAVMTVGSRAGTLVASSDFLLAVMMVALLA